MRIKCEYCGSFIDDKDETCPYCGGVNAHLARSASAEPKTIEELKEFCKSKNLPLAQMRFFIGEDYKEPKAFGIYKDGDGNFVVYKNKGDGTRAVRYSGKDEAYAVNEIYQKLKTEIAIRREKKADEGTYQRVSTRKQSAQNKVASAIGIIIFAVIIIITVVITVMLSTGGTKDGYYDYNGSHYYHSASDWYVYDALSGGWRPAGGVDSELSGNASDYWEGSSYSSGSDYSDFSNTDYYSANSSYNDDWDNDDWDWGGGDWDAGNTNWDTDW